MTDVTPIVATAIQLETDQFSWYVARAAGITAWFLAAFTVLWGLFLSTGVLRGRPRRPWLLDLHRFIGGLTVTFTAVHMAALVADDYVHFGWRELLVPFASEWRPEAVAWGVVAFWLLVAVEATSLLRRRPVPERVWRAVHASSFVLFAVGTIHLVRAGTDAGNPLLIWPVGAVTATTVLLTTWRLRIGRRTTAVTRADTPRPAARPTQTSHRLDRPLS